MTISLLLSFQGKRHTKQWHSAGADFVGAEAQIRKSSKDLYECLWVLLEILYMFGQMGMFRTLCHCHWQCISKVAQVVSTTVWCAIGQHLWHEILCIVDTAACSKPTALQPEKIFSKLKLSKTKLLNTCRVFHNFEKLRIQTLRNLPNSVQNLQIPSELKLFQVPWKTFQILLKPSDPRTFQIAPESSNMFGSAANLLAPHPRTYTTSMDRTHKEITPLPSLQKPWRAPLALTLRQDLQKIREAWQEQQIVASSMSLS